MGSTCTKTHIESQEEQSRFTEASVCFADEDSIIIYFSVSGIWIGGIRIYQTFPNQKAKLASEVVDELHAAKIEINGLRLFSHGKKYAYFLETWNPCGVVSPFSHPQATLDFGKVYSIPMNCV